MEYENKNFHKPVLLREVLYYLSLKQGDLVFDGTLGGAGHSLAIIKVIAPTGKIIGVDLYSKALSTAARKLKGYKENVILKKDNFSNIKAILWKEGIRKVDKILLDLGLSSFQIERSKKGFSYMRKEKLDMRFSNEEGLSAFKVINEYPESELLRIFFEYGQERWSKNIVKNILKEREVEKISDTGRLVDIIKNSIPGKYKYKGGHPAKRIFQAIRIEVNKELDNLKKGIMDGFDVLKKGGRMAIISYHSLEDRIVKDKFLTFSGQCTCPPDFPVCRCGAKKEAIILTKKPVRATEKEVRKNPRSKSAKLRAIKKIV